MAGYVKLFGSILRSTVWGEPDSTRLVWITMLALADRDGIVEASVPGLAHEARVSLEATQAALATFLAPDQFSRTKDFEGRRIEEVRGGWRLLNADLYRRMLDADDQREKAAERQRRFKERGRSTGNGSALPVTPGNGSNDESRHAEAEAEAEPKTRRIRSPGTRQVDVSKIPERAFKGADYLRKGILAIQPTNAIAAIGDAEWPTHRQRIEWANTLRLMVERQKRNYDDIATAMQWLYFGEGRDSLFVIHSADSLRNKFDKIQAARQRPRGDHRQSDRQIELKPLPPVKGMP